MPDQTWYGSGQTIRICVIADGKTTLPTDFQIKSVKALVEELHRKFNIQPEFICCLGTVAAQNLLDTKETIGRLRKQFFEYHGAKVLCTYHPAYLLRNPPAKRDVWEDLQLLMAEMGLEVQK